MKIVALKDHECFCCGKTISKGDECIVSLVNPSDSQKAEFKVIYTCSKCIEEEAAK